MYKTCYKFEKIENVTSLLDDCVDATYIIHLEGNGRLEHIYKQLEIFKPTQIIYIVHNKGFTNCEKGLHENSPPID